MVVKMKKFKFTKVWITVCLALGIMLMPVGRIKVQAAEVIATVQGTVMSGTTSELLKLSTKDGEMHIKLDSGTDVSECKILLPGKIINVSVARGSDEYLHAVKISVNGQAPAVSLDSSKVDTITGTISEKSKDDVLYFNTPQGEMQIKFDATTNMSGCTVLVMNKTYVVTCVRGSDAYMHAVSISDASGVSAASIPSGNNPAAGMTPAPFSAVTSGTSLVSGTVGNKTKEGLLYLSTTDGEMEIAIDGNTDSRNGMFLIPGRKLAVYVYRGSDAYMHAASIVGVKEATLAPTLEGSVSTVTGTVGSKSTENVLYLSTTGGDMELKLDALNSVTNCKVFVTGKRISVTCSRGTDAYMHAISISGI